MQKLRKTLDSKHFFYEYKFGRSFFSFDGSLILNPNKEFVKKVAYYSTGALVVKTKLYKDSVFANAYRNIFFVAVFNFKKAFAMIVEELENFVLFLVENFAVVKFCFYNQSTC